MPFSLFKRKPQNATQYFPVINTQIAELNYRVARYTKIEAEISEQDAIGDKTVYHSGLMQKELKKAQKKHDDLQKMRNALRSHLENPTIFNTTFAENFTETLSTKDLPIFEESFELSATEKKLAKLRAFVNRKNEEDPLKDDGVVLTLHVLNQRLMKLNSLITTDEETFRDSVQARPTIGGDSGTATQKLVIIQKLIEKIKCLSCSEELSAPNKHNPLALYAMIALWEQENHTTIAAKQNPRITLTSTTEKTIKALQEQLIALAVKNGNITTSQGACFLIDIRNKDRSAGSQNTIVRLKVTSTDIQPNLSEEDFTKIESVYTTEQQAQTYNY